MNIKTLIHNGVLTTQTVLSDYEKQLLAWEKMDPIQLILYG